MIADDVCPGKWIVGVLFMSVQDGGLPDSKKNIVCCRLIQRVDAQDDSELNTIWVI